MLLRADVVDLDGARLVLAEQVLQRVEVVLRLVDGSGKELNAEKILADLPPPAPQVRNFMESVRERRKFALNESNGFRSCTMFNLAIAAERTGRGFRFDPVSLRAVDDEEANRFLYPSMRGPWENEFYKA